MKWMTSSECHSINQELNMLKVVWLDPFLTGKLFLVRASLDKIQFLFCGAQEVLKLNNMNDAQDLGQIQPPQPLFHLLTQSVQVQQVNKFQWDPGQEFGLEWIKFLGKSTDHPHNLCIQKALHMSGQPASASKCLNKEHIGNYSLVKEDVKKISFVGFFFAKRKWDCKQLIASRQYLLLMQQEVPWLHSFPFLAISRLNTVCFCSLLLG